MSRSRTLLALAVQPSQSMIGIFTADELVEHWRVATDVRRTADDWGLLVSSLVDQTGCGAVDAVSVCSAVPTVLPELRAMAASQFPAADLVVVGPGIRTGLSLLMDNPREVGTDRITNAVAALELFGAPCVVVDLGAATTFDVLDERSQYVGGAIAAGPRISMEALSHHGAQLRQVELTAPRSVIAKNTVEALQSGTVFGAVAQVDGMVARIVDELGPSVAEDVSVVATGIAAPGFVEHCRSVTAYEPWLLLHGLALIHRRSLG